MKLADFSFVYPWELRKKVAVVEGGVPNSLLILLVLFFGALLFDTTVLTSSAQEKEVLQDDSYICTHIHEYPIEQHEAILGYCIDLAKRGL